MKYPKILVTGATGRTGSAVVDELLAKGVPESVVADRFDLDQLPPPLRPSQLPRRKQMSARESSLARNSFSAFRKEPQSMNQPNRVQEYGVTERANWRRSFARKAAARKDRSCHLPHCSESV